MRLTSPCLFIAISLPALAQPAPKDRPGCVDSKLLSRMPGCAIIRCQTMDYNAAEFRIKDKPNLKLEGAFEEIDYSCPPKTSRIEIIRNAEQALKAAGYTIRFQMDGANWAGVTGQNGPQWIYVQSRIGTYLMRAVKTKALEVAMEASADGWAKQIQQSGRVSIYGINFDTGKATIRPDSEKVLAEVAGMLQKNPAWRVAVVGHTDNVGAKELNLTLSRQRAQSVATWLNGKSIAMDRLLPGGFGDLAPVADNSSEEGRAKNRRVDLVKLY